MSEAEKAKAGKYFDTALRRVRHAESNLKQGNQASSIALLIAAVDSLLDGFWELSKALDQASNSTEQSGQ